MYLCNSTNSLLNQIDVKYPGIHIEHLCIEFWGILYLRLLFSKHHHSLIYQYNLKILLYLHIHDKKILLKTEYSKLSTSLLIKAWQSISNLIYLQLSNILKDHEIHGKWILALPYVGIHYKILDFYWNQWYSQTLLSSFHTWAVGTWESH